MEKEGGFNGTTTEHEIKALISGPTDLALEKSYS